MHKVILVDDELLDLEGMEKLIDWNSMTMQVVASFHSPLQAYDYIHSHSVDILITDIGMPQMSGIELAERCKALYKQLKIVFVSGFQDFSYAQKAIDLHANGYILKPFDDHEILRNLEVIRDELEEAKSTNYWKTKIGITLPFVKNEVILRWLEGSVEPDLAISLLSEYGLVGDRLYSVALLELDGQVPNNLKMNMQCSDLFSLLMEQCERLGIADFCMISDRRLALILHGRDCSQWQRLLEELLVFARQYLPMTVTIGWGKKVYDPRLVHDSYVEAIEVLDSKLFIGKDQILTVLNRSSISSRSEGNEDLVSIYELFAAVLQGEQKQIHTLLDSIVTQWRYVETRKELYQKALKFISDIEKQLLGIDEHIVSILEWDITNTELLAPFETLTDIQCWLKDGLNRIADYLSNKKQNRNNILIENIKRYIEERLHSNVSLRDVAEQFGFSANHLGVLFKEATGCNFRDFIIETRIERAKSMLRDPSIKIYEIAYMIGYQNDNYFYRQFKDIVGITPNEFRKSVK